MHLSLPTGAVFFRVIKHHGNIRGRGDAHGGGGGADTTTAILPELPKFWRGRSSGDRYQNMNSNHKNLHLGQYIVPRDSTNDTGNTKTPLIPTLSLTASYHTFNYDCFKKSTELWAGHPYLPPDSPCNKTIPRTHERRSEPAVRPTNQFTRTGDGAGATSPPYRGREIRSPPCPSESPAQSSPTICPVTRTFSSVNARRK